MNNSKDFIENKIQELVLNHNQILCRYEFHSLSDAHFIEINPSGKFNEIIFKEYMMEILSSFYNLFPNESLVFITEKDGFEMESPVIVLKGSDYQPSWAFLFNQLSDQYDIEPIIDLSNPELSEYTYYLAA